MDGTWQGAWRRSLAPSDRRGLEDNDEKLRYLKSWMLLRFLIGALGLSMVLMTWLGSALLPGGQWALKGSLSAYYYSGMREFFTCALTAIETPYWFGAQPIMEQRITGLRLIWPDEALPAEMAREVVTSVANDVVRMAAAPMAIPAPLSATIYGRAARRYAHLAVIDGGRPH